MLPLVLSTSILREQVGRQKEDRVLVVEKLLRGVRVRVRVNSQCSMTWSSCSIVSFMQPFSI